MKRRPHIIVTLADDDRYDALGALGDGSLKTPCLDRLIGEGTCFSRTYIPGSTHAAVCAPSRAQLHTGRTLYETTDQMTCEGEALPTLGMLLGEQGYRTVGVGKWHNGDASFRRSFKRGHHVFHGGMSSHFCVPCTEYVPNANGELEVARESTVPGHSVDIFTNGAIGAIEDYAKSGSDDEPFFLYVAMTAPHDPRETYWRFRKEFRWQDMPVPESFLAQHPFDNGMFGVRDELLAERPRSDQEVQQAAADYAAILMHMDDGIGRIHTAAHAAGLTTENTLFVHSADHGIAIGRHGLMGKQSVYEHSMRPPLVAAGPGFERGAVDDRLSYMQDLFPTLLEAGGASVPGECRYNHLQSTDRRTSIGSGYEHLMRMVRDERYKLIHTHAKEKHRQLFDLKNDPQECRNLLVGDGAEGARGAGEYAGVVDSLNVAMASWRKWACDGCASFG